jgi:hypothetical protein
LGASKLEVGDSIRTNQFTEKTPWPIKFLLKDSPAPVLLWGLRKEKDRKADVIQRVWLLVFLLESLFYKEKEEMSSKLQD